jgi:hypothetical protein
VGDFRFGSTVLATTLFWASSAWAQSTPPVAAPVTPADAPIGAAEERERTVDPTSLNPVGAHFGAFTLFPKLDSAVVYDSNIYALENKTSDTVFRLSPSFNLNGNADPFKLTVSGRIDRLFYAKNSTENRTDWRGYSRGSVDFAAATTLSLNAGYSKNHEDRGDPNAISTTKKPTVYYQTDAGFEVKRDAGILKTGLRGTFKHVNYNDSPTLGGFTINNDDRDRSDYFIEGNAGYEFSTGYSVIARLAYDTINYNARIDDFGYDRHSTGIRGSVGVAFELSQLLTGEATVGYLTRNYRDARFATLNRVAFNAQLEWFITELTSMRFTINNQPQETVAPGYRGYIANTFAVRVEHELTRTVKLTGTARYVTNDYLRNIGLTVPDKSEKYYGASAGVQYVLNRFLTTTLGYDYNKKTSNVSTPGSKFVRNKASLSLMMQF